jgi:hypothetical protein
MGIVKKQEVRISQKYGHDQLFSRRAKVLKILGNEKQRELYFGEWGIVKGYFPPHRPILPFGEVGMNANTCLSGCAP